MQHLVLHRKPKIKLSVESDIAHIVENLRKQTPTEEIISLALCDFFGIDIKTVDLGHKNATLIRSAPMITLDQQIYCKLYAYKFKHNETLRSILTKACRQYLAKNFSLAKP